MTWPDRDCRSALTLSSIRTLRFASLPSPVLNDAISKVRHGGRLDHLGGLQLDIGALEMIEQSSAVAEQDGDEMNLPTTRCASPILRDLRLRLRPRLGVLGRGHSHRPQKRGADRGSGE